VIRRARRLTIFVLAVATVLLALLQLRLFQIQVLQQRPVSESLAYRWYDVKEQRERGMVLDRRGGVLACSITGVNVFAWSPDVADRVELAEELSQRTGVDPADVVRRLDNNRWARLVGGVMDPVAVEELRALRRRPGYRALWLEPTFQRVYPRVGLFAPLLGYVDQARNGVFGVESLVDPLLIPAAGMRTVRKDNLQRELSDPRWLHLPPSPGASVALTLDPLLQKAAEEALDDVLAGQGGRWAQALIVNVPSGELLAVAQRPAPPRSGRPRTEEELNSAPQRLLAAQDLYLPGSTFKPLMLALALENQAVNTDERIHCNHGLAYFGRRALHDTHGGSGALTPAEILVRSSNIGMAKMTLRMVSEDVKKGSAEFERFLDYFEALGLTQKMTGLPREQVGLVPALKTFSKNYTLVSLAMGHEIGVTALQMATACTALIRGGLWRPLQVVLGAGDSQGNWYGLENPQRRVVSEQTSQIVRNMMRRVVEEGSVARHRPRGYSVGGKTGTPEKEQDRSKISPSFVCFAPAEEPELLLLMIVDEPERGRYASEIVAPYALRLLERVLRLCQIPPDRPEELDQVAASSVGSLFR
jgi:cell division protein FtsI/penicillin-binding protein 2